MIQGIVVKKTETGEDNQSVTFYTRDFGKLTGVAKSVKKRTSKQAYHLDLFNLVDFLLVFGNGYPIITSAQSRENFAGLKSSLAKTAAGFFVLEVMDYLVYDGERDLALWRWLKEGLEELAQLPVDTAVSSWLEKSQQQLVSVLGYQSYIDLPPAAFLESLGRKKFLSLDFLNAVVRDQ